MKIPLSQIVEPFTILRLVDKTSLGYMELRNSIEEHGVLNSVLVRPAKRHPGKYELVDGLYRFTIARELDLESIPAIVKEIDDDEVLSLQIQTNAIRPETKPIEYAAALKRLLTRKTEWSINDLSVFLKKSPTWINQQLGLLTLNKDIQIAVERGEINVSNAYLLAKLPSSIQLSQADNAKTLSTANFRAVVEQLVRKTKDSIRRGIHWSRLSDEYTSRPRLRSPKVILSELEQKEAGPPLLAAENAKSPLEGFYLGLQWCLRLDRFSIEKQKDEFSEKSKHDLDQFASTADKILETIKGSIT